MKFTVEEGFNIISLFTMWVQQAVAEGRKDFDAEKIGEGTRVKLDSYREQVARMPDSDD